MLTDGLDYTCYAAFVFVCLLVDFASLFVCLMPCYIGFLVQIVASASVAAMLTGGLAYTCYAATQVDAAYSRYCQPNKR